MSIQYFGRSAGLVVALMMAISGSASAQTATRFACSVDGAAMVDPAMSPDAICARFKAGVDAALGAGTARIASAPDAASDTAGWISVHVVFKKPGIATASVTDTLSGRVRTHPDMSVAVSDRAIGPDTIEMLVGTVARSVSKQ